MGKKIFQVKIGNLHETDSNLFNLTCLINFLMNDQLVKTIELKMIDLSCCIVYSIISMSLI